MEKFTIEVLAALRNGATPTLRVNNAIELIRYRKISMDELSKLINDIKLNWRAYHDSIWIADSVESFVRFLKQDYEYRKEQRQAQILKSSTNAKILPCDRVTDIIRRYSISEIKSSAEKLLLIKPISQANNNISVRKITLSELALHITGEEDSFNHILNHKVPKDGKKCNWIGSKADAIIFADYLKITPTKFSDCFTLRDGKKLIESNRGRKEAKDSPLYAILYHENQ